MVNIGILGTGFGMEHLRLYSQTPDCRVVRVYGRNPAKLTSIREQYGVEVTSDPDEVIVDSDIGLVDICLPSDLHIRFAARCLEQSKCVFIETPLCYDPREATLIRDLASRMQRNVYVSSFMKFFNEYAYLKSAIADRRYGDLHMLVLHRDTPSIWSSLGCKEIVHHFMIHDLDFLSWAFDDLRVLHTSVARITDSQSAVLAALQSGKTIISLRGCSALPKCLPMSVGFRACFDSATMDFTCAFTNAGPTKVLTVSTDKETKPVELVDKYPYQAMIEHVVDCENGKCSTVIDMQSALASLQLASEIARSAITCG